MAHPHNSGLTLRIFLKFYTMKGAIKCYIEIMLMAFPKKNLSGANGPCRTQIGASSQLWISCQDCFTILYSERGQDIHGNYIDGFSEKKSYSGQFGHFGLKMVRLHDFGFALRFFFFNFAQ